MSDLRSRGPLALVAVLALVLRLISLFELRDTPVFAVPIGDAQKYDAWAQDIANGQWIGTEVFYQTPLYPYLLAAVFAVRGHDLFAVRLLQALLGSLSCVLLALAGRRFFSERAGLVAALMLAVYPPAIFFDGLIQKASLDLFFMTLLLFILGAHQFRPNGKWLVAAGVTMGLFTLNRENTRVLFPIIALWLLGEFRDKPLKTRINWVAVFTVSIAVVLLPVGLRNYLVGGDFLVSTSQLGPNFFIGNHAGARGSYEPLVPGHGNASHERDDATHLAEADLGHKLSASEVSGYWLHRGLQYIQSEPWNWLRLMGRKVLLTFGAAEVVDTESITVYSQYSVVLRAFSWIHFGVVLPLAVFGIWLTRRDWRRLVVLHAILLGTALSVAVFFVLGRYRYPMVPIVLLFAASALSQLPNVVGDRSIRCLPGVFAAFVAAVVVNQKVNVAEDDTLTNIGSELIRTGKPSEAIPLLEKAVQTSPDHAVAYLDLAVALNQTGQKEKAIEGFKAAVRLQPDYFEAHDGLALTLQEIGRSAEALEHFREALRLRPDSAETHSNFGMALAALGQRQEAMAQYQESLRVKPTGARAHNNLGVALHQEGKVEAAIPHYEAAIVADPAYAEAHSNLALALAAQGKREAAVEHFREALRRAPNVVGIHTNLADLLTSMGRLPEAITEYQRAVTLSPDSMEAHFSLAQAYGLAGRLPEAIVDLEKALAIARAAGQSDVADRMEQAIRACRARLKPR